MKRKTITKRMRAKLSEVNAEMGRAYREASFARLLMLEPPTCSVKRTERGAEVLRGLLRRGARRTVDLEPDAFLRS